MDTAVFLDRDGTLNEEVGYLDDLSRFRLLPMAGPAVKKLNDAGRKVLLISNQSGVARGLFPESFIDKVHGRLQEELALAGAHLDGIYYCPHHPEGQVEQYRKYCDCRKPRPGMLRRAASDWRLDLTRCYVVGDKYLDVETAHAACARGVLVLTGYGRDQYLREKQSWQRQPEFVAEDVLQAAEWIIGREVLDARNAAADD